jgi:hypothetical protein
MTQIPPPAHPAWRDILTGRLSYQPTFLGARVLVMRFRVNTAGKANPDTMRVYADELRQLYEQNRESPSARQDLAKIFG